VSDPVTPSPSPEVVAVIRRMVQANQDRDIDTLRNFYSQSPVFRAISTDAYPFVDAKTFLRIAEVQWEGMPIFERSLDHVEAYELGDVAWGTVIGDIALADGTTFSMRNSLVFVIEDGLWRCVHIHGSIPVDDEELLGVALTKTLADLVDSLDGDTLAPIGGVEGTETLMFTDIEDSTVLAQEMGDKLWSETIEDHDRFVVAIVEKHGGTVIKTLGDGALVAFGGARAALRCAGDLQAGFAERPFAVRIGIHAGDLVRTEDDVVGLTVNKAARVAAAAAGGQVVISSIVRELVGGTDEFSYRDPFLAELKGIEGVHELIPLDLESGRLDPADAVTE
jgi:adenylate cyclase